jgi:DNA-binding transcriptional ArsR family regulator
MWELALGERLTHRPVLQAEERVEYIENALNLNLVRTTEYVKPYNPQPKRAEDRIAVEKDAALLDAIVEKHDQHPALITTTTALKQYDKAGVIDVDITAATGDRVSDGPVDSVKWYGDVLGSNEFDDTRLGVVIGSNHYGDEFIQKWGAYAGEAVERGEEKGNDLSYGRFGDAVLRHMREHDTLQAAMRFGRDGNGAVVYVHTDTLPEWVPLAGEGRVVTTWSNGMEAVIQALEDLGEATTAAVVEHPDVDLSRQQVFKHLEKLREQGVLNREQDDEDGRRVVWQDDGLYRLSEHGDVELAPVELEDPDDETVRQLARNRTYTWGFTNQDEDEPSPHSQSESSPVATDGHGEIKG